MPSVLVQINLMQMKKNEEKQNISEQTITITISRATLQEM